MLYAVDEAVAARKTPLHSFNPSSLVDVTAYMQQGLNFCQSPQQCRASGPFVLRRRIAVPSGRSVCYHDIDVVWNPRPTPLCILFLILERPSARSRCTRTPKHLKARLHPRGFFQAHRCRLVFQVGDCLRFSEQLHTPSRTLRSGPFPPRSLLLVESFVECEIMVSCMHQRNRPRSLHQVRYQQRQF